jgi:hypothetical protein
MDRISNKKAPTDKRIGAFEVFFKKSVFYQFHCFRMGSDHVDVVNSAR